MHHSTFSPITPRPIFFHSSPSPYQHQAPSSIRPVHYRYSTAAPSSTLPTLHNKISDSFLDSVASPSNVDESIILADEEKHKRGSSIADVYKKFRQKTLESLSSKSFSYQSYTTPSQNIKIMSDHTSTTPAPVLQFSPTPKLTNPYENIDTDHLSPWPSSDIVISFKSEPQLQPPHDAFKEKKIDIRSPITPFYSVEDYGASMPVRFDHKEVIVNKNSTTFFDIFFYIYCRLKVIS